jgi:hypothetical protein
MPQVEALGSVQLFVKATELAIALALPVLIFVLLHQQSQGIGRGWIIVWLVLTLLWNALLIALALKGKFPR